MPKVLRHFLEMAVSRRIFNRFPIFLLHAPRNELYFLLGQPHLKKMKNIMLKWRWKKFVTLEIRKSTGKILYHSIRKSILSPHIPSVWIRNQYISKYRCFSEAGWQKLCKRWNHHFKRKPGGNVWPKSYRSLMHWLDWTSK